MKKPLVVITDYYYESIDQEQAVMAELGAELRDYHCLLYTSLDHSIEHDNLLQIYGPKPLFSLFYYNAVPFPVQPFF